MNFDKLARTAWVRLNELAITPLAQFFSALNQGDRTSSLRSPGNRGCRGLPHWQTPSHTKWQATNLQPVVLPHVPEQGRSAGVRVLRSHFGAPDYHLMNHLTIRMEDGTTQIDHVLVSRFGVFVVESKDYSGWLFGKAAEPTWTQVRMRRRFKFQNPILQNKRHVRAVRELLEFLPPEAVKSVVVFCGDAEFKTEIPPGVLQIDQLAGYVRAQTDEVMSLNRLQFCVGRLETTRLAISAQTDVEHVESLARRLGTRAL